MKKVIVLCIAAILAIMTAACQNNSSSSPSSDTASGSQPTAKQEPAKQVKLEFMSNLGQQSLKEMQTIAEQFTKENPNITVNVSSQGADFEALMKAKMASNDLPDLWTTHGWAVERYNKFLLPLNDQPWAGSIKASFKPIITNKDNQVVVLPVTVAKDGVIVNKTILEKSGVQIDSIRTWEDFLAACEKIKNSGFTPVGMWGKDPRSFASFLDNMANPLYISSPSHAYGNELKDGTFDWSIWKTISDLLTDLKKKGYLNKDVLTATENGIDQAMAKDQVAFKFRGGVKSIVEFNPKVNIGIMPFPAFYSDDQPYFPGGEGTAIGVWKDTKLKEEALKFLNYLTKAENVKRIGDVEIKVTGLTVAESDLGVLTADYKKYENAPVHNFFDRIYLPNGMWSILQQAGAGLVSGQMTSDDAAKTMKTNYDRLRSQNQ